MTKLPNTLIKLTLLANSYISLQFVANLTDLQELQLLFGWPEDFGNFEKLQYTIFSQLQILRIQEVCPRYELLIKFLENNGKNLRQLYIGETCAFSENSLNLAIAKLCPNLRKLSTGFKYNEMETLSYII
jgi:hypothetical protein